MRFVATTGGIAAFTAAWFRPDFRRRDQPHRQLHQHTRRLRLPGPDSENGEKNIRILYKKDDATSTTCMATGVINQQVAKALEFKGYDYKIVWGDGHSGRHGTPFSRLSKVGLKTFPIKFDPIAPDIPEYPFTADSKRQEGVPKARSQNTRAKSLRDQARIPRLRARPVRGQNSGLRDFQDGRLPEGRRRCPCNNCV